MDEFKIDFNLARDIDRLHQQMMSHLIDLNRQRRFIDDYKAHLDAIFASHWVKPNYWVSINMEMGQVSIIPNDKLTAYFFYALHMMTQELRENPEEGKTINGFFIDVKYGSQGKSNVKEVQPMFTFKRPDRGFKRKGPGDSDIVP
jgi:hypothetical protein